MSTLNATDVLPVTRGTTTYKVTYSDLLKGSVTVASDAEVTTGTDTTKAVSPKGVKDHYIAKNITNLPVLP
jgi:hypothetical protein